MFLSQPTIEAITFTQVVTPYLPLIGTIFGGMVIGAFAIWNRKRGAVETRAPDVNEIWQQQVNQGKDLDREYRWRRRLQNFSDELLRVFHGYVSRVQAGGDTSLTAHEKVFFDAETPNGDTNATSLPQE